MAQGWYRADVLPIMPPRTPRTCNAVESTGTRPAGDGGSADLTADCTSTSATPKPLGHTKITTRSAASTACARLGYR
jgi:hypothetical protein